MMINRSRNAIGLRRLARCLFLMTAMVILAAAARAQDMAPKRTPSPLTPYIEDLKGVAINMTADQAIEKLGKPKVSDKAGMYFQFSGTDSAQVGLDAKHKVRTVALIYRTGSADAMQPEDVFGPDVLIVPKKDGSIYKMVRYPSAGFWIAYSKTGGSKPMTTVTMRRIGS